MRITNKYAEEEMELKYRGYFLFSDYSRYLDWKPFTIKEIYFFLKILILMGSDRRLKIEDYWRISRAAGEAPSPFYNYIGLKRFEIIYRVFTTSPLLVNEGYINDPPRCAPTPKWKLIARDARPSINISSEEDLLEGYWVKVESLASYIRETCQRMYTPGTYMIIDEVILAFRGRFKDIIKFKNKLISEDFKNWVLAEYDYVWN